MKTSTLISFLFLTGFLFSQTSVIATKSHSTDVSEAALESDNFGEMAPSPTVDTVVYLSPDCVIHKGENYFSGRYADTVCDYWYYQQNGYSRKVMKNFHGEQVVLIHFPEEKKADGQPNYFRSRTQRQDNSILFWVLLSAALGSVLVLKTRKKSA